MLANPEPVNPSGVIHQPGFHRRFFIRPGFFSKTGPGLERAGLEAKAPDPAATVGGLATPRVRLRVRGEGPHEVPLGW
jgi:hypothetical protein